MIEEEYNAENRGIQTMYKCKRCNEYRFYGNESCSCKKFIVESEYFEKEIYSLDFEYAAEKAVEEYDEGSGEPVTNEIKVSVTNSAGETKKFIVSGEYNVHYSVSESEEEK